MVRIKELRLRAWENVVQKVYWRSVVFCVLIGIIITGIMTVIQSVSFESSSFSQMLFSILFSYVLMFVAKIFIINNFYVSWIRYFLHGAKTNEFNFGNIGYGFTKDRYFSFVKILFIKDLCLLGWFVLIYIPMILFTFIGFQNGFFIFIINFISMSALLYMYYDYSFVSYILSDDEEMEYKEAIDISKRMAKFHKKNIFLVDLFFWGWFLVLELVIMAMMVGIFMSGGSVFNMIFGYLILAVASAGIMPYYLGTKAQLYLEIKLPKDLKEDTKEDIIEVLKKLN